MLFVECKPDFALIISLSCLPKEKVEHAGNKTGVLRKLVKGSDRPNYENSIGIVDEDPLSMQVPDFRKFNEIESLQEYGIRILRYKWLNNHIVVLCPQLEGWIINASREANVDVSRYGLPCDPNTLHALINANIESFGKLLEELSRKSARVKKLNECIQGLRYS